MIKSFDIKSNEVSFITKIRDCCMLTWDGTDVEPIFKSLKIAKRLVLHTLVIQQNAIMKPKYYNNATANKRNLFINARMKVQPLCLPIFNDAKECLFQGKNTTFSRRQSYLEL